MTGFAEPILHVDMDAFFVEVERRRRPDLVGVPVVVGGAGARAVVASASYEARRFGVRSAMPMVQALQRCPGLRRVAPDHAHYTDVSRTVFAVLHDFTPHVEPVSIDEAFLDIAGLRLQYPDAPAVAHAVRAAIRRTVGLPCSVGIAATKFLAKMASQEAKPDGVYRIAAGRELEFLHPLPVRRLWGVGEATHAALERLGVATIGDLAALPGDALVRHLGRSAGEHLAALAAGSDPRPVVPSAAAKSISVEETYERDLTDEDAVRSRLFELTNRLSHRLRRAGQTGRTVVLKVRYPDFETLTRRHTVAAAVATEADIWPIARSLYESLQRRLPIRLLGVGVASLEDGTAPEQLSLAAGSHHRVGEVADRIRDRFGDDAIRPARLAERRNRRHRDAGPPPNTP